MNGDTYIFVLFSKIIFFSKTLTSHDVTAILPFISMKGDPQTIGFQSDVSKDGRPYTRGNSFRNIWNGYHDFLGKKNSILWIREVFETMRPRKNKGYANHSENSNGGLFSMFMKIKINQLYRGKKMRRMQRILLVDLYKTEICVFREIYPRSCNPWKQIIKKGRHLTENYNLESGTIIWK